MRIAALVESIDHVCCRYRVAAFRDAFAAAGHPLEIRPLPRTPLARLRIGRDLGNFDAVIVQRKLLPRWMVALLRRRAKRLIFDFDDAVWLRDSYSRAGSMILGEPVGFGDRNCDLVSRERLLAGPPGKHPRTRGGDPHVREPRGIWFTTPPGSGSSTRLLIAQYARGLERFRQAFGRRSSVGIIQASSAIGSSDPRCPSTKLWSESLRPPVASADGYQLVPDDLRSAASAVSNSCSIRLRHCRSSRTRSASMRRWSRDETGFPAATPRMDRCG